jgi:hypothetical protein
MIGAAWRRFDPAACCKTVTDLKEKLLRAKPPHTFLKDYPLLLSRHSLTARRSRLARSAARSARAQRAL